MQNKY